MHAKSAAQPGVDRATFMARVRASLEHAATAPPVEPPPAVDESIARLAGPADDLVSMFNTRATTVGMQVHALSATDLPATVARLLRDAGVKTAVVGFTRQAEREAIEGALAEAGVEPVEWKGPDGVDRQFDVDAGVTDVHAALAETGTLVCNSDADHGRALSLVPPLHVAVVRASDILPDMIDYWAGLKGIPGPELPSNMNFITGPNKTADIEGELVTGVHGPERVHILIVTDG
jgi:L-lactate dehydrogenase complex protein LldG